MPDYPSAASSGAQGVTMISRRVPTFAESGFTKLAECPVGKNWKVKTIWVRNRSSTKTYWISLTRVPRGWIGAVSDDNLYILGPNEPIQPGKFLILNGEVGLGGGDSFYGFQIESTGDTTWGLNMVVAGEEVG